MMSIDENKNFNIQETSAYQIFLLYIRSPKTIKEYNRQFDKFFNFLINKLGETDFRTDDLEAKYSLLYIRAKKDMNWFKSVLYMYIQFQKNRVNEEKLSGATFSNYFKALKKFCFANELEVKWERILIGAPKINRAAKDKPPTISEIRKIMEYGDRRIKFIVVVPNNFIIY